MKVLVADYNPLYRHLLHETLAGWGYDVVAVADGSAAWSALQGDDPPKLAVLDWMMPGLEGPEVCRRVRLRPGGDYVYVLLLTAKNCQDDLLRGLEAGADDCLRKPFHPPELRARLSVGQRILGLQDELITARELARHQAMRDALTGVFSRGAVMEALTREIGRAARSGQPVGVALADLDHFKAVNDTHGHLAGDAVLREAAQRMAAVARQGDHVGRFGGEEFLLVLPGCEAAEAVRCGERLRQQIAAAPFRHQGAAIGVTLSVGVAVHAGPGVAEAEALLHAADVALYRAKFAGRDRVELGVFPAESGAPGRGESWLALVPPPARGGDGPLAGGSRRVRVVAPGAGDSRPPGP